MPRLLHKTVASWARPKIDLSGCVFYAPLWRPDLAGSTFYDLAGHNLCTVYGATYGNQGRIFDGDDYIKSTTAGWRSSDQSGSILFWAKTNSGTVQTILASGDEGSAIFFTVGIRSTGQFYINTNPVDNDAVRGSTNIADNTFHSGMITSDGSAWTIYADLNLETLTVLVGSNSGIWLGDIANRDNITVGVVRADTFYNYATGTIGDVLYYTRVVSLSEYTNWRNATKWRY